MNTHLSIALHALTLLANATDGLTSDAIAEQLQTNPVFLRRVLSNLKKQGIVVMRRGAQGGIVLNRAANELSLDEVFRTLQNNRPLLPMHNLSEPSNISRSIDALFEACESDMIRYLSGFTLKDLQESANEPANVWQHGKVAL